MEKQDIEKLACKIAGAFIMVIGLLQLPDQVAAYGGYRSIGRAIFHSCTSWTVFCTMALPIIISLLIFNIGWCLSRGRQTIFGRIAVYLKRELDGILVDFSADESTAKKEEAES